MLAAGAWAMASGSREQGAGSRERTDLEVASHAVGERHKLDRVARGALPL